MEDALVTAERRITSADLPIARQAASPGRYDHAVELIDWGDVPTWVAAVFGGGAFAGALLLFRIESKRDDRRERERAEHQAGLVTGWIRRDPGTDNLELQLLNASSACVYEDWVVFESMGRMFGFYVFEGMPPNVGSLRSEPIDETIMQAYSNALKTIKAAEWQSFRPVLYFRDSLNARWKRDANGVLTQQMDADGGIPEEVLRQQKIRQEEKFLKLHEKAPERPGD
jgi:hypothetical protein